MMSHVEVNFVRRQTGEVDAIITKTKAVDQIGKTALKTEIQAGDSGKISRLDPAKWSETCE